jgi:hypothetical protein
MSNRNISIQEKTLQHLRPLLAGAAQAQPWRFAGEEPPLGELLADPLLHLVMKRDGVTEAALQAVIEAARGKLAARTRRATEAKRAQVAPAWRGLCCGLAA